MRSEIIRTTLEKIYGKGAMVTALAGHIEENWDYFERSDDRDELFLCIWNWFAGGGTAEIAANHLREAVGAMT